MKKGLSEMDKSRHFLAKINSFDRTGTRTFLTVLALVARLCQRPLVLGCLDVAKSSLAQKSKSMHRIISHYEYSLGNFHDLTTTSLAIIS